MISIKHNQLSLRNVFLVFVIVIQCIAIDAMAQKTKLLPLQAGKSYHIEFPNTSADVKVITPPSKDGWAVVDVIRGFSGTDISSKNGVAININQAVMIQEIIKKQITAKDNRDAILSDLEDLAADAYQYKIRPASMGGGNGSYTGFTINALGSWGISNTNATYEVITSTATQLKLRASSKQIPGAVVEVTYDGNGKVTDGPNTSGF